MYNYEETSMLSSIEAAETVKYLNFGHI